MQGQADHYQIVGGKLIAKRNHAQDIKDLERTLKHPLYPDNAYFSLQHFNLFTAVPSCELHAMTLGVFQHLVSATFYKYELILFKYESIFFRIVSYCFVLFITIVEKIRHDINVDTSFCLQIACTIGAYYLLSS